MPLSEHEQRMLDQIERGLYAEDPKFASNVRGARMRNPSRRRKMQGVAVFLLGVVLLVVGAVMASSAAAIVGYLIAIGGFLLMFAGVVVALFTRGKAESGDGERTDKAASGPAKSGFAQRMEERFRRRFEGR